MGLQPGSYDARYLSKEHKKLLSEARRSFRITALTDFGYINLNGQTQLYTKKQVGWFKTESEFVGDLFISESDDDFVIACAFYSTEDRPFPSRRLWGAIRHLRETVKYCNLEEKLGKKIIIGAKQIEKS
jgi:hypothetical protein